MTAVRRLLAVTHGGGSFEAGGPFSLATTGFGSDLAHPRAAYYNGKTYLIWITDAGDVKVSTYTHATQTVGSATTLHSGFTPVNGTIHVAASIIVRDSDHKLVVAYAAQGAQPFYRISTSAEDTSAFGSETAFMASHSLYTYSFLNQLDNGNLVYISRYWTGSVFRWTYIVSTDSGATWGSQADILVPDASDGNYLFAASHGDYVHIFCTDTERSPSFPSSVYHLYLDGATLRKSDGTSIAGPYPVAASAGTLVQDDSGGSVRCNGIAFDGSGNPSAMLLVNDSDAGTTNTAKVATWSGSWSVTTVAGQGGRVDSNNFVASAAIASPTVVYLPVKVGSFFEIKRYTYSGSWTAATITTGSAADNAMPEVPVDAAPGMRAVWGRGTYTDENDFDFTLYRAS